MKRPLVGAMASAALLLAAVIASPQIAGAGPGGSPPAAASAPSIDTAQVNRIDTGERVRGAVSVLRRTDTAIGTKVRTRAQPRHAYTLWYVIFNAPEACSDGVCDQDDIFLDPADHSAGFNAEQIEAARVSAVFGGGAVANRAGRLKLRAGLEAGEIPTGPGQVLIGLPEHDAIVPLGVVTGLEDARSAEIHIVLQGHGRAHRDPGLRREQLTRFQGACNPECADEQFAVHLP